MSSVLRAPGLSGGGALPHVRAGFKNAMSAELVVPVNG